MQSGRIYPHEMSGHHGGVVVNEGEKGTPLSMITENQHEILRPTSNQRALQKSNGQYACKRAKVVEWPPSLKKVCLVQEGPETPR
jgi:hypothetical protein